MKRTSIHNVLAAFIFALLPLAVSAQEPTAAEPIATATPLVTSTEVKPAAVEAASAEPATATKPGKGAKAKAAIKETSPVKPAAPESVTGTRPAAEPTGPTVALDRSSLAEIENATKAMNDCAAIADEIAAQKVPPGYVATRKRKATKAHPENKPDPAAEERKAERAKKKAARDAEEAAIAKGPKAPKGPNNVPESAAAASPVATTPDADDPDATDQSSETFIQKMDGLTKRFDTCGQEYERAAKSSEKIMKTLSKTKLSKEDSATAGAAAAKFQAAQEKLAASIDRLSNDRQIQAYVHPVLKSHFLKL